jgi:hypothetical protein
MAMTGVSHQTATNDLVQLVEGGFLRAEGETRNRVYVWLAGDESKAAVTPPAS